MEILFSFVLKSSLMTTNLIQTKFHNDVKSFIFSKIKDDQITNDLLQETFIKVHTKLHTLKDDTKLKSWVFSIARHTVIDFFRENNLTVAFIDNENIIVEESEEHTEKDCLRGILKTLPKKYRYPLFLSDIKGLKQKDIANTLNLKLATTKSRIQRARNLIKQAYVKCCDYKVNEKGFLVGEVKRKEDCKMCN